MKKQTFLKLMAITLFSVFFTASTTQITSAQTLRPAPSDHVHPIPLIPIVVDGIKMSPEEISKYDGQPLYYLVNDQARSEGVVYIFTTLERLIGFEEVAQSTEMSNNIMSSCTDPSAFYNDPSFGGTPLYRAPGQSANLYNIAFYAYNYNIESVKTTDCNVYTKLYGPPGQLWLACCGDTPNLNIYGWENEADYLVIDP